MSFSTTDYPYRSIVRITDQIGNASWEGSGVLISPDEVLTASHVVYTQGIGTATNIRVTPGETLFTNGSLDAPFGTFSGSSFHYFQIADSGDSISNQQSQFDYAVIHLSTPLYSLGYMGLRSNFAGGQVHVTGFPATANGNMTDSVQSVHQDSGFTLLDGSSIGKGSSGGPVWQDFGSGPQVVGVVSAENTRGTGFFTQITTTVFNQIEAWVQQDDAGLAPAPSIPSTPPSSPPSTTPPHVLAGGLSVGSAVQGSLSGNGSDWYSVSLVAGQTYTIDERGFSSSNGTLIDPFVHVRDASGGLLAENDDVSASNLDAHLVWTAPATGTYFIEAAAFLSTDTGSFTLSLAGSTPAPPSAPLSTTVNGAEAELIDSSYYLAHNPDVAAAGIDAALHFTTSGWREGRNPDAFFDVSYYLQHNPDVAAAGIDPLLHYAVSGWKEGRDPSASFSTSRYLAANSDVKLAGADPLEHYLLYGITEHRSLG